MASIKELIDIVALQGSSTCERIGRKSSKKTGGRSIHPQQSSPNGKGKKKLLPLFPASKIPHGDFLRSRKGRGEEQEFDVKYRGLKRRKTFSEAIKEEVHSILPGSRS